MRGVRVWRLCRSAETHCLSAQVGATALPRCWREGARAHAPRTCEATAWRARVAGMWPRFASVGSSRANRRVTNVLLQAATGNRTGPGCFRGWRAGAPKPSPMVFNGNQVEGSRTELCLATGAPLWRRCDASPSARYGLSPILGAHGNCLLGTTGGAHQIFFLMVFVRRTRQLLNEANRLSSI